MGDNFLVSDALKDTLTRDVFYEQAVSESIPQVFELRNCKDRVELDILFSKLKLQENISLSKFEIDNIIIVFSIPLVFKLERIHRRADNLLMSTIVIDSNDFWSNLK